MEVVHVAATFLGAVIYATKLKSMHPRPKAEVARAVYGHPAVQKDLARWNAKLLMTSPMPQYNVAGVGDAPSSLADFKGKTVVLEWTNYGCPFVKKHYSVNNMQTLQKNATDDGVVWISINSGGKGKQGYLEADEVAAAVKEKGAHPTHYIRDPEGSIGKLYAAKTTPHIFIVNGEGTLVYQGAIDDNSSHESSSIKGATNYVTETLAALKAGKPVAVNTTQSYGCSVKYK